MNASVQISRITEMEAAFDRVTAALHSGRPLSPAIRADIKKLEGYYLMDWMSDFEADERGKTIGSMRKSLKIKGFRYFYVCARRRTFLTGASPESAR